MIGTRRGVTAALIVTTDLGKRYGRRTALEQLSIEVPAEGVTALTGPNGAGKSTFLRLCVGFERPSSGSIAVGGFDPLRRREQALALTAYVPQTPALYRDLSARDHVALARSLRPGFDHAYARARLASLDINPEARPLQLSGGQQAQLSLALALATRAPIVLLDEPLANLDPLARRHFLAIVADAVHGGDTSVILSSHVISEIEEFADRLLVLGEGRALFYDTVTDSMAAHRVLDDPSAADLTLGRAPSLEEVVLGYLAQSKTTVSTYGEAWRV